MSVTRGVIPPAILAAVAVLCMAARAATVSGIVADSRSGEVVIGATVMLEPDTLAGTRGVVRGAVTNKFGFYSVARVAPGSYRLSVRAIGYRRFSQSITFDTSSIKRNIALIQEDLRAENVTVEGEREAPSEHVVSTIAVKPEFIQQLPALGGEVDIFRALQLLPGVKAGSEISSGLYVRGGSPDQNLTLLDGVIVYNPSHLGGFLSTFNADAVRDITLIKGAFPAEYGGRLSSVLDMTMREGTKEKISGTAGVSLIDSRATVEGPLTDNATFMLSGRRMYLDLILHFAADPNSVPGYYFYDLNGKVNLKLSDNDHLYLSGYFGRDVFSGPPDEKSIFDLTWGNSTGNLRWMHIVSPTVFTNFSAIYTDYSFSSHFEDPNYYDATRSSFKSISGIRDAMVRGEAQIFPNSDHVIKTGVEATFHRFRADASANIAEFARLDAAPTIRNSLDISLYGQDEWHISPLLSSNLGARVYYFQSGNYVRAEPRISLSYSLTDAVTLKGAFSTGNQFLHLVVRNDLPLPTDVWFPSTSTVPPEDAMQGVLGAEISFDDRAMFFSVEAYDKRMRHLLEYKDTATFSLGVPIESAFTSGTGDAYGVEFFLQKRTGAVTGWLGYTLAWTKRTFPELNNGQPFYARYDRRHDISAVITYKLGEAWQLGASWVYGTGQAYTLPTGQYAFHGTDDGSSSDNGTQLDYTQRNGTRLPAFHKLDVNFTHSFSWFSLPWAFSINVYNLYNHLNTFAEYWQARSSYNETTGQVSTTYVLKRVTLFPIIPTFGLSCRF